MANVIIGTTPTIRYTFKEVEVASISTAFMTIKKDGRVVVKLGLDDADIGEDSLAWTLTQEDTLAIGTGPARVMLNWVLADETRGASVETDVKFRPNHIPEVI